MTQSIFKRYIFSGIVLFGIAGQWSSTVQAVALYDATVEADLVVTTTDPGLVLSPAIGFVDFYEDVTPASQSSDAFADADFFSTAKGFTAYAHADGMAVPGGVASDTTVVESYGESFAFMDLFFFNQGTQTLQVDLYIDYLWDYTLSVDSLLYEFAGIELFLEFEIDGIFTSLVDLTAVASPGGSDFGGGLELFSFDLDPLGFSTFSMNLIAGGSAESTVPLPVSEPKGLVLMLLALLVVGYRGRRRDGDKIAPERSLCAG